MTESPGPLGRLDLRALDADDPRRVDRVTGTVLQRIAALPRRPTPLNALEAVSQYARPTLAAAALILAVAASLLIARRRDPSDGASLAALASWAAEAHTPTNGELLATFAGYAR